VRLRLFPFVLAAMSWIVIGFVAVALWKAGWL
jgi:hypothetical protein